LQFSRDPAAPSDRYRRAILARVELTTQEARYQWLNTCFLIGEGEIDEEREDWCLTTYVCVNEEAQGPPAIGAEPPERFRQRSTTQAPVKERVASSRSES
jgi:hypothetical protein